VSFILGISAFYHDSAACIIKNGSIIAAAQEERFTRVKHDSGYPYHAVEFVLKFANLDLHKVDKVVFFEKPFLKFERLLETYVTFAPRGFLSFAKSMPLWIKEKLYQKNFLINKLKTHDEKFDPNNKLFFSNHHLSHAASAYYPSPFNEAVIITADGVGEWATTTVAIGKENKIEIKKEIHFPHSLGLLYSAFTYYTGFKVNGGEYKLMGLAPYGKPTYVNEIRKLIDIKNDGTFRLNQDYFDYATGLKMTNDKFHKLFGKKPRDPDNENLTEFHMDIAASIQSITEEIMIKLVFSVSKEYEIKNLCLAGGVALNCVANGKILKENIFEKIWVQPAAGDAGGSLGAALALWHNELGNKRIVSGSDIMNSSYLGPEYSDEEIQKTLNEIGADYKKLQKNELLDLTVDYLDKGYAIGWFQGRMEFGPRALGNRSIIGDARSPDMQKKLNIKVKFRESFRPFAPSVLYEDLSEWFDLQDESPYMLMVTNIANSKLIKNSLEDDFTRGLEKLKIIRSEIPAVTHVDNSARVQTVTKKNGIYYELIKKFKDKTGCPVIVNTSFNVRGEPPVNTPLDAYKCFMLTDLDLLVIGNYMLKKDDQIKFRLESNE